MPRASTKKVPDPPLPTTPDAQHSITEHYDRAVTIKVGRESDTKTFDIYRGMLKFYSGYFGLAIKNLEEGKFAESKNGMIELPDEEVAVFEDFKRWLYAPNRKMRKDTRLDWEVITALGLCKLWCFGEARIIPLLQNRAIDLLVSQMSQHRQIHVSAIRHAYEHSAKDSHLRRLLIFYLSNVKKTDAAGEEWPPKDGSTWFTEFAQDLAIRRMDGESLPEPAITNRYGVTTNSAPNAASWDRCAYHVHDDGKKCGNPGWKVTN